MSDPKEFLTRALKQKVSDDAQIFITGKILYGLLSRFCEESKDDKTKIWLAYITGEKSASLTELKKIVEERFSDDFNVCNIPKPIADKIDFIYQYVNSQIVDANQNTDTENSETYMNVPEVARLTKYTEQTIRTKVMNNEIPSHKMDGKRIFKKSEILKWISEGGSKGYVSED